MSKENKTNNNLPMIGLDMLHIAEIIEDTKDSLSYGDPEHVPNLVEAGFNPNASNEVFFADNGPAASYSQIGAPEITINAADLSPKMYAKVTGAKYEKGQVRYGAEATAPDVAVGYRRKKTNGEYRHIWFYKGKFSLPEEDGQTASDSVEFQTQELTFTAVARMHDGDIFTRVDSDDKELPEGLNKTTLTKDFFSDVEFSTSNNGDNGNDNEDDEEQD